MRSFIGAALISLFVAACWFLWIHLKSPCHCGRRRNFTPANNSQFPKGIHIEYPHVCRRVVLVVVILAEGII